MGTVFRESRAEGQAKIQQAQLAIVTQVQVLRFDIAMEDVAPVQHAHGLQQLLGKRLPIRQWQGAGTGEQLLQGLARVFTHQVIQVLTLAGRVYFGEVTPGNPAQEPLFEQQALQGARFILALLGQGFQQPGVLLVVVNPVQQGLPALAEGLLDRPAIDRLAATQGAWQRPLLQLRQGIAEVARAQLIDPHQQCAGVVLAAAVMGRADQRVRRVLQVNLFAQHSADLRFAEAGPDAIAEQDEAFTSMQIAFEVVDLQVLIQAQGAL
ncbi:hypothetical protein D3C75_846670 [compost metagenome]